MKRNVNMIQNVYYTHVINYTLFFVGLNWNGIQINSDKLYLWMDTI